MDESPNERPAPLEYAPRGESRGIQYWARRFLARLSKPMPLAYYYLILVALSVIAFAIAVVIRVIIRAFGS